MPNPFNLVNLKGFKLLELDRMLQDALRDKKTHIVTAIMAEFRRREDEAKKGK